MLSPTIFSSIPSELQSIEVQLAEKFKRSVRDVSFFMRRGGLKILWGGGTFFSEPKKGGHVFFQSLILNIFFKKRYAISEIRV